jgi:putative redox protein
MKVNLKLDRNMRIIGTNAKQHETIFDSVPKVGGEESAPTPMEIMLQAMGSCSFMDVISILRKKRKQVDGLEVEIDGERRDEHPKIFTKVHLKYTLKSPDSQSKDLERAVELSQDKYCGAAAMFKLAGCEVTWEAEVV